MINKNDVVSYWKSRSDIQKELTVGFGGLPLEIQNKNYETRKKFIFEHVSRNTSVLDYGCGIGRYSSEFNPDLYLGVDITKNLIDIAIKQNPTYKYKLLSAVGEVPNFDFSVFFTATVLQHNSDETVSLIFENVSNIKKTSFTFCLYENSQVMASHVKARKLHDYASLVDLHFNIKDRFSFSHNIHGEQHDLNIITV